MKIVVLSDSEGRTIKRYRETQGRILLSRGGQFSRRYLKEDSGVIRFDGCAVMSHPHATLSFSGGKVWIADRNSRNGTCVNGEEIYAPTELKAGDTLMLGKGVVIHGREITPAPLTVEIEDDGVIPEPIEAIVIVSDDESVSSINDSFFEDDDDCSVHAFPEAPLLITSTDQQPEQPYYSVQSMHKEWERVSQQGHAQQDVLDPSDAMALVEEGGAVASCEKASENEGTPSYLPSVGEWRNGITKASPSQISASLPSIQTCDASFPPLSALIVDTPLSEISDDSCETHDDRLSAGSMAPQITELDSPSYDVIIGERDVISRDYCFASTRPDDMRTESSAAHRSDFSTETEVAVGRCSCMTCSGYYQRVVKGGDSGLEKQTADSVSVIKPDDEATCLYDGPDVTQKVSGDVCHSSHAESPEKSAHSPASMTQEAGAALDDLERIKAYPVSTRYAELHASNTSTITHASSEPFSHVPVFAPFDPEKFASVAQKPTLMDLLSHQPPSKSESGDEMSDLSQADSEYVLTSASDDLSGDDAESVGDLGLPADYEESVGLGSDDDLDSLLPIDDDLNSDIDDVAEEDLDKDLQDDIDEGLHRPSQDVFEVSFDSDMDIECDEELPITSTKAETPGTNELHVPAESANTPAASAVLHFSNCDDLCSEITEETPAGRALPTDTDKAIALLLSNGLGRSVSEMVVGENRSTDSAVAAYSPEEYEVSEEVLHDEDEICSLNCPNLEFREDSFASESEEESSQHTYSEVEDSKLYDSEDLSEDLSEDDSVISSESDSTIRFDVSADGLNIMREESVSESEEEEFDGSEPESEVEESIANAIEDKEDYLAAVRNAVRQENANREEYEACKRDPTLPKPTYMYRTFYQFMDEESEAKFTESDDTSNSDGENDSGSASESDGVSDLMVRFCMPEKEQLCSDAEGASASSSAYEEDDSEDELLLPRLSEEAGCVTEDEFMQDIAMIEREEASDSEVYDPAVAVHMANKKKMHITHFDTMMDKINRDILEMREDHRRWAERTKEERQKRQEILWNAMMTAAAPVHEQNVSSPKVSGRVVPDEEDDAHAGDSASCELESEVISAAPGAEAADLNPSENTLAFDGGTDNSKKEDALNSPKRTNSTIGEAAFSDIYNGALLQTTSPSMALNTATMLTEAPPVWSPVDIESNEQSMSYSNDAASTSGVSQKLTHVLSAQRARATDTNATFSTADSMNLPATVPGRKRSRDQVARDDADATPEATVGNTERAATRRRISLTYALNAVRPIVASIRKPVVSSVGLGLGVVLVANAVDALL